MSVIEDIVDASAVVIRLSADFGVIKVVVPEVVASRIPLERELRIGEAVVAKVPSLAKFGVPLVVTAWVKDPTVVDHSEFVSSSQQADETQLSNNTPRMIPIEPPRSIFICCISRITVDDECCWKED
ncbi:unnamed protein product [Orchesella dallaii]|uniref:S1 motif domain-containing protein n=1 Tax=Orchesella dallaii TaxID=48710 RepID=A0ABP1RQL6_9HEXA